MAAIVNIAGATPVIDPAYRYKMPLMMGKIEGKGNGIKTVLLNVNDVALSLKRDPAEVTKFFGCELGAQTSYDPNRAVVNGSHRDQDLQTHLSKYIENFVLCKNCRLPETHYKIKDGLISEKCLACGSKDPVDMRNKLTTFILSQHKKNKEAAKAAEKADRKGEKKKEKTTSDKADKADKKAAAEEVASPEKKKSSKKKTVAAEDDDEAPENVFGIKAEEDEDESDSKAVDDGIDRFKNFLMTNPDANHNLLQDELRNIQIMLSLRPADRIIIYLGAVFNDAFIEGNAVAKNANFLKVLAPSEIQQRQMIAAFEWLCGTRYASHCLKLFPKALMQLYESDVIDEEVFIMWSLDTTRNEYTADASLITFETLEKLHENAKPFVVWLQEAEEEGDEDDEEGDEEEEDDEGEDA